MVSKLQSSIFFLESFHLPLLVPQLETRNQVHKIQKFWLLLFFHNKRSKYHEIHSNVTAERTLKCSHVKYYVQSLLSKLTN